jgi:hypothetical protein
MSTSSNVRAIGGLILAEGFNVFSSEDGITGLDLMKKAMESALSFSERISDSIEDSYSLDEGKLPISVLSFPHIQAVKREDGCKEFQLMSGRLVLNDLMLFPKNSIVFDTDGSFFGSNQNDGETPPTEVKMVKVSVRVMDYGNYNRSYTLSEISKEVLDELSIDISNEDLGDDAEDALSMVKYMSVYAPSLTSEDDPAKTGVRVFGYTSEETEDGNTGQDIDMIVDECKVYDYCSFEFLSTDQQFGYAMIETMLNEEMVDGFEELFDKTLKDGIGESFEFIEATTKTALRYLNGEIQ